MYGYYLGEHESKINKFANFQDIKISLTQGKSYHGPRAVPQLKIFSSSCRATYQTI